MSDRILRRVELRSAVACSTMVLAAGLVAVFAATSSATSSPQSAVAASKPALVTLSPAAGPANSAVLLQGQGFKSGQGVTVMIGSRVLATATTDHTGVFRVTARVPAPHPGSVMLTSKSLTRTVRNLFVRASAANGAEVAASTGPAVRWALAQTASGRTLSLSGRGLRPATSVTVWLAKTIIMRAVTTHQGGFTGSPQLPSTLGVGTFHGTVFASKVRLPYSVTFTKPLPPVGVSPPTITGVAQPGQTLTEHHGAWANTPSSYRYQWRRCDRTGTSCTPVAGATGQTYALTVADVGHTVVVAETAVNAGGASVPAESWASAVVEPPVPFNTTAPSISGSPGSPHTGSTLTAQPGIWSNDPTSRTYAWERCDATGASCASIPGATGLTYSVTPEDLGSTLRVQETAANDGGDGLPAISQATAVVIPAVPENSQAPSIPGVAQQGQALSAQPGSWSNAPSSYGYQWERCDGLGSDCGAIVGATSSTYMPTAADVGDELIVTVTASNAGGASEPVASPATGLVLPAAPVNEEPPVVLGTAAPGQSLTEQHGAWDNGPTAYADQWERCDPAGANCVPVDGATGDTYAVTPADIGQTLVVQETASNAGGQGGPASSTATETVPLVLANSTAQVPENGSVSIDVLAGDGSADPAHSLTLASVSSPADGTATITGGHVEYTPTPDDNGSDQFTYRACDDRTPAQCADAQVNVTVTSVNQAPVIGTTTAVVQPDGSAVINPLVNDSPGPSNESGQHLTLTEVDPPSYGTATLNNGQITYVSRAGHNGSDWFQYQVCDDGTTDGAPDPKCSTGTVTVWVVPVRNVSPRAQTNAIQHPSPAGQGVGLWRNASDTSNGAVFATDAGTRQEDGGIGVYDLTGHQLQWESGDFVPPAVGSSLPPTNTGISPTALDVRDGFDFGGASPAPIVVASESNDNARRLDTFSLDPTSRQLTPTGAIDTKGFPVAGMCLYHDASNNFYAFVVSPDGTVEQWRLYYDSSTNSVVGHLMPIQPLRSTGGSGGACTVDDARGELFVASDAGIVRFHADPSASYGPTTIDTIGAPGHLTKDVSGLAVAPDASGTGGSLIAAMNGGTEETVYSISDTPQWSRTVRIGPGNGISGATANGLAATGLDMGSAFPDGLLVAEDTDNADVTGDSANPNAKLVKLDDLTTDNPSEDSPQFPARPASCSVPYSSSSPFNSAIPANAPLDAQSEAKTAYLASLGSLTSNPDAFTYPVYDVSADTPEVSVTVTGIWSDVSNSGSALALTRPGTVTLPMPADASPAAGYDSQIIVVNPSTGDEWGLFQMQRDASGNWTAENGYHYNTAWSGVPPLTADGQPFGSRGAGLPYLAGLVRPCELDRGEIDHAVGFAYQTPTAGFVSPAAKSDGTGTSTNDLPEGTRLQLDPSLTTSDLQRMGCNGPCLTIAEALQTYGMYLVDNAGHPKVMLEARSTAGWGADIDGNTTGPIPLSSFRVLASGSG